MGRRSNSLRSYPRFYLTAPGEEVEGAERRSSVNKLLPADVWFGMEHGLQRAGDWRIQWTSGRVLQKVAHMPSEQPKGIDIALLG